MLDYFPKSTVLLLLSLLLLNPAVAEEHYFMRVGTGPISGVYYTTGNAVCRFIKKYSMNDKSLNVFCSVQSTPGTMYNLNALRNGDLEVAAAQGDWGHDAYRGTGLFTSMQPMSHLRSLFATHKEAFTALVRKRSNIRKFSDIKNKIVNIGAPGTGVRGTIEKIMEVKGWTTSDFKLATEMSSSEQVQALCDGKIDVMTMTVGHPNGLFQEASATCDVQFIELDKEIREKLLADYAYYYPYTIRAELYPALAEKEDVDTISVRSVFYANGNLSDDKAYKLISSIFRNFSSLQNTHPIFLHLAKPDLIPDSKNVPLHPGVVRFYKQVGLLQDSAHNLP